MFLLVGFLISIWLCAPEAALPKCASGAKCPPGGLWSEWALSGSSKCPTTCGSCTKIFYTRDCLSDNGGCNCTGPLNKYVPCNTQTCQYPSQRTCCIPYVPMLINGAMQCGPIPKETVTGSGPCCPEAGIWSEWSKFAWYDTTQMWTSTRECISTSSGCPCTGSETRSQAQVRCSRQLSNAADCAQLAPELMVNLSMDYHWELMINDKAGTALLNVVVHNDNYQYSNHCSPMAPYNYVPALVLRLSDTESQKCVLDRPMDCWAKSDNSVKNLTVSFTCDQESEKWRYDYLGVLVDGYNQPKILNMS